MRTYAIGDIHGQFDKLQAAHALIAVDRQACDDNEAPIVHVGDLVDRGPESREVVEFLRSGLQNGQNWIVLKGNHDRMFTTYMRDPTSKDPGLSADISYLNPRLGGGTTLGSYGVKNAADRPLAQVYAEAVALVPSDHLAFLDALPTWFQRGDNVFVHAGLRPGVALKDQIEDDLIWIRGPFLSDGRDFGALVVHGHTALDLPIHYGNRLNIDSGAGYGRALTTVVIEGRDVWVLTPGGRVPLLPTPNAAVR